MTETVLLPPEEDSVPLERVFLDWKRPALHTAAALLAEHYAADEELRMGSATVVLPGARAGRRLKELVLEEAQRRGVRLVPPRVITTGSLPELLYSPARPLATDTCCLRAWARALRELPRERLSRLFAVAPADDDVRGWTRLARTVAALHQEVGGAGLRFADVVSCCSDGLLFADTERWSVLASAQAAYEALLERLDLADRGLARLDALQAGGLSSDRDLWLLGVVEMPGVLRRMLESSPPASGTVRVLVHAPEAVEDGFDPVGCLRPEAWCERAVPLRDDQVAVRGRPGEQAAEVVRTLASLGGRYAAEEIAIGVPNEELVPYVEQQLAAEGVGVHAGMGTPVERSPVVRLLSGLADYLDGNRYEACAALARHPDVGRWLHQVARPKAGTHDWLEALDAYFTECLPAHLDGGLAKADEGVVAVVEAFHTALTDPRLLGRLRGRRALSAWMPELMAVVTEVYGVPALDRSRPADRRLLEACECLRDGALELHRLPAELDETCDAATAIRLLVDEVAGGAIAPDPDRDAVEMLGWLDLRLDESPVAVVTGFNEPYLPESVNAHAFLPNALRERLGLEDNARRYARDAYELTALLHSREVVRVIAGRRSATGDPLRPSRLLFAVEGPALAERVRRFFSEEAVHGPASSPAGASETPVPAGAFPDAVSAGPARPGAHPPDPGDRLPSDPGGPVRLRAREDPAPHAARRPAAGAGRTAVRSSRPRGAGALRPLGGGALRGGAASPEPAGRGARRRGPSAVRCASAPGGADPAGAAAGAPARLRRLARPVGGGRMAGGRGGVLDTRGGRALHGGRRADPSHRPDRPDRLPPGAPGVGALRLQDRRPRRFAGGHAPRRPGNQRFWTDLQLPLYRYLLPEVRDAEGRRPVAEGAEGGIRLGYVALPRSLDRVGCHFADWSEDELSDADECACGVVRLLRENAFAFDPERARAYRSTPLATVLGLGYLEGAADAEEKA